MSRAIEEDGLARDVDEAPDPSGAGGLDEDSRPLDMDAPEHADRGGARDARAMDDRLAPADGARDGSGVEQVTLDDLRPHGFEPRCPGTAPREQHHGIPALEEADRGGAANEAGAAREADPHGMRAVGISDLRRFLSQATASSTRSGASSWISIFLPSPFGRVSVRRPPRCWRNSSSPSRMRSSPAAVRESRRGCQRASPHCSMALATRSLSAGVTCPSLRGGVEIERDAQGDGLSVADVVPAQGLELVRRPVTEVERPRGPQLEWISAVPDVVHVEDRAADDHPLHGIEVARSEARSEALELLDEGEVLDGGHLEALGKPADPVPVIELLEEEDVVEDGEGRRKGADQVLHAVEVDGVLDPHARVALGEDGGRDPDEAEPAVEEGRRESDGIENRASADDEHVGVAAELVAFEVLRDASLELNVVLRVLAAGKDGRGRHENEVGGVRGAPPLDPPAEAGPALRHTRVDKGYGPPGPAPVLPRQGVREDAVLHGEEVSREDDVVGERDLDLLAVLQGWRLISFCCGSRRGNDLAGR